jgi:hypothetical protein
MVKENHGWKTWAIDEEGVQCDGYTWEEMYHKQRRVPGLVLAFFVLAFYWTSEWSVLILSVPFVLYSAWPALGAYTYMKEEKK